MRIFLILSVLISNSIFADVTLPKGALSGCPFIHEDSYDVSSSLELLKSQIGAELNAKNECQATVRAIYSNLSAIHDFNRAVDPKTRAGIARDVYQSAVASLETRRGVLEAAGKFDSMEYASVMSSLKELQDALIQNEISLRASDLENASITEAYYRNQLLMHASGLMSAYASAARSKPECIQMMGGWSSALSTVLGAFSVGTGLGFNSVSQAIGAAAGAAAQLVDLLRDTRVRSAYNSIIRQENAKTLACTYYSIKRASCEYQRTLDASLDYKKLREFWKNEFKTPGRIGEYERFFMNRGSISIIGRSLELILQMGSPLTLDKQLLTSYLSARAVDFDRLPPAPAVDSTDEQAIRLWLIRARALGIVFSEFDYQTGTALAVPVRDQLEAALRDRELKLNTIGTVETLIKGNQSFIDLKRKLPGDLPILAKAVSEVKQYLIDVKNKRLVDPVGQISIDAAQTLLTKMEDFLKISVNDPKYEELIIFKGAAIYDEVARGSVPQMTEQTAIALFSRGTDRLNWALNVVRNAYLNRDVAEKLPESERFSTYQVRSSVLADLRANYTAFAGAGKTFRSEDLGTAQQAFEKAFRKEFLDSIERAMEMRPGISKLEGVTAAHLCALYASSLSAMSRESAFGENRAAKLLARCQANYKSLEFNRLVTDDSFKINYADECTYMTYTRELDIQALRANLF